jgi:hypothetical protein
MIEKIEILKLAAASEVCVVVVIWVTVEAVYIYGRVVSAFWVE